MAPNLVPNNISYGLFLAGEAQKAQSSDSHHNDKINADAQCMQKAESLNSVNDNIIENQIKIKDEISNGKIELVWRNVIIFIILHSILIYVFFLLFTFRLKFSTVIFSKYFFIIIIILYLMLTFSKIELNNKY